MKKILVTMSVLLVLGIAAWVVLALVEEPADEQAQDSIQGEVKATVNPIEVEIPELNPAEGTNPFEGTYKNPFE